MLAPAVWRVIVHTSSRSFIASLSLGLVVAACGGSDAPSSASGAVQESIRATCAKAFACRSAYDPAMNNDQSFENSYGTSESDCYDRTVALVLAFGGTDYFDKLDASAEAGRIAYNADDLETCLDALDAVSCDAYFGQNGAMADEPAACQTVLEPQVPIGGSCTIIGDCRDDADCDDTTMTCM
jgi:hypothetical protein